MINPDAVFVLKSNKQVEVSMVGYGEGVMGIEQDWGLNLDAVCGGGGNVDEGVLYDEWPPVVSNGSTGV